MREQLIGFFLTLISALIAFTVAISFFVFLAYGANGWAGMAVNRDRAVANRTYKCKPNSSRKMNHPKNLR